MNKDGMIKFKKSFPKPLLASLGNSQGRLSTAITAIASG